MIDKVKNEDRPSINSSFRYIVLAIWTSLCAAGLIVLLAFQYEAAHLGDPSKMGDWAWGMFLAISMTAAIWLVGTLILALVTRRSD